MIVKGNTHNDGAKLADYLFTGKDAERAEVWQLRGFEATNIKDAFRDIHIISEATHCEQPFFHVQVRNPDGHNLTRKDWEYAADRIERKLGFAGQPRAIAFHIKGEEEHMHIAWSRIDERTMTARELPYSHFQLKGVARELELHFGMREVTNHRDGTIRFGPTRAEFEQARRLGLNVHEVRETIRACYDRSDSAAGFQAELAKHDYTLAKGDHAAMVVLDHKGGIHALNQRLLDQPVAKIRATLSDARELPGIQETRTQRELAGIDKLISDALFKPKSREQMKGELAELDAFLSNEYRMLWGAELEDKPKEQQKRKPFAPELSRDAGQIRLAYSLTNTGQEFADALEDRGLILARITKADADRLNKWEGQRLKEIAELEKQLEAAITFQQVASEVAGKNRVDPKKKGPEKHWREFRGGVDQLPEPQRQKAEAAYDAWSPVLKEKYDFHDYVTYVQDKHQQDVENGKDIKYQRYKVGELVVINQFGQIHQLSHANTGDNQDDRKAHLKDIDRNPLLSVSAADSVMQHFRQHARDERKNEWEEKLRVETNERYWAVNPQQSDNRNPNIYREAAEAATSDHRPADRGAAGLAWDLWTSTDQEKIKDARTRLTPKGIRPEFYDRPFAMPTDIKAFVKALDDNGMMLAYATSEDAAESHRKADFAREVGNYSPRFREGEIVIITERPYEYPDGLPGRERSIAPDHKSIERAGRIHRIDQALAQKFVRTLDEDIRSIDVTFSLSEQRLQKRRYDNDEAGTKSAKKGRDTSRKIGGKSPKGFRGAGLEEVGMSVFSKTLDVIAGMFESFAETPREPANDNSVPDEPVQQQERGGRER